MQQGSEESSHLPGQTGEGRCTDAQTPSNQEIHQKLHPSHQMDKEVKLHTSGTKEPEVRTEVLGAEAESISQDSYSGTCLPITL